MGKPEIRFKGYTDEWEQRKLGDWGNFYYGRSCPKWSVTEDATIPCIRYGELYTKFGAKIDRVYSYTNMPPENLRFSKGTEVLIPRVGEDPMDYNHCTWLSMQDVAIGEMISVFNTDNNPLFTATMFNATLQNEFAMRVEGGSVTNLYFEKLKNIDVSFPSIPEQEKIAAYFENFDHLITLHQRKCDEVKTLKKYMLQKMFPQNEQKIPEIRFEGFTEAWEQRKLGDLVDRVTRKNQDLVSELPLTISAQYGLIDQNEFFDKRVASKDVSGYYLIENGEFAYNKSTSTDAPWGAIKRLDRYENGVLSTLYIIFGIKENNPVDSDFLVSYYSTNLWHKGIHEIAAEGARNHGLLNIAPADFFETKLMIPQDIEEQKKIGKYFEELERLITLHQRKCDEVKSLKKYMLQKMFPQNEQKVPEIRFKGFTEAWEQRKLGELYQRNTERNENLIGYDKTISVATMSYKDDGNGASESSLSTYKVIRVGDIAFEGHTNKQFRFGRFVVNDIGTGIMSPRFSTLRPLNEMPVNFWKQYIHSESVMRRILVNSTKAGTMMNELVIPEFLNQTIMVPSENEQAVIGQYFTNIDHLITLHQQKCEELKKIKKFMLQKMFV